MDRIVRFVQMYRPAMQTLLLHSSPHGKRGDVETRMRRRLKPEFFLANLQCFICMTTCREKFTLLLTYY